MNEALLQLARDTDPAVRQAWIEPEPSGSDPGTEGLPDPLVEGDRLRREHPDWSSDFAAAVAGQRELVRRARERGEIPPGPWLLTRTGLEQSTRPAVALRRARHLSAAGMASMVDLTAGLGLDTWAATEAGLQVLAIERDPLTAALCGANVPAARVRQGDARTAAESGSSLTTKLSDPVCWFVDPARRGPAQRGDGRRSAPERDPQRWSPPWEFVESLVDSGRNVAAKAPGGFTPAAHWAVEWVGIDDYVVECAAYSLPTSPLTFPRQATLMQADRTLTFEVTDEPVPVGDLKDFIAEPHPVFHRALPAICQQGMRALHSNSTWLTADSPSGIGVRWFRVLDTAPLGRIRTVLSSLGIDAAAIKSRESRAPLAALRKKFAVPDGNHYAVVIARDFTDAIVVERSLAEPR